MKIVRRGALPVGGDSGLDGDPRAAPTPASATSSAAATMRAEDVWDGFVDEGALVRRPSRDPPAARRRRRRERDGRRDAPARPRAPAAARRRPLLLRARRDLPEPRAEPAPPREPRVHRREDARRRAPISASRTTATPIAASSSTTRASSCPATSSRRSSPRRCWRRSPGAKVIYDVRASWAVPRDDRAGRRRPARQPRRPRVHQAADARGGRRCSPARSPRTTTSATSRRPTRASCRSSLMLELLSHDGATALGAPRAVPRAVLPHGRDQHAGRRRRR